MILFSSNSLTLNHSWSLDEDFTWCLLRDPKPDTMQLTTNDLNQLCATSIHAARNAGRLIAEYSKKEVKVQYKAGGDNLASQVVTEVDLLSQQEILKQIEPTLKAYDLALLTEESEDNHSRLEKDYFWCIDPLDGTLPFTESKPGYAVSIALVSKAGIPQIGVVYDPVTHTLYHAVKDQGAFRNEHPWHLNNMQTDQTLTLVTDHSFLKHPLFNETKTTLENLTKQEGYSGLDIIYQGGAAMNACWVLEHAPACYFKYPKTEAGGGSLWDYAATACIFREIGASVSDIHGQTLELNRKDSTFMNHRGILYAHSSNLAKQVNQLYNRLKQK